MPRILKRSKKSQSTRLALRTRPVPEEVAELLSIANRLPRELGFSHDQIINAKINGFDDETLRYVLDRALEKLPADLAVFVRPGDDLLDRFAEGWQKALGRFRFQCAVIVSGGLLFPTTDTNGEVADGTPFFGLGEVEAMKQRYLFIFAVREIFRAASEAHTSLDDARRRLRLWQGSMPPSALGQVTALRGRLEIASRSHPKTNDTHRLVYAQPAIAWVFEKIEAERIRECPVCEKLFWAGRLNQSACGPRCSNVQRARNWRKSYLTKYKDQRTLKSNVSEKRAKKATKGK